MNGNMRRAKRIVEVAARCSLREGQYLCVNRSGELGIYRRGELHGELAMIRSWRDGLVMEPVLLVPTLSEFLDPVLF